MNVRPSAGPPARPILYYRVCGEEECCQAHHHIHVYCRVSAPPRSPMVPTIWLLVAMVMFIIDGYTIIMTLASLVFKKPAGWWPARFAPESPGQHLSRRARRRASEGPDPRGTMAPCHARVHVLIWMQFYEFCGFSNFISPYATQK